MIISVITVSYNCATTIGDTVRSDASQTHLDMEHLVIDGLFTDDTVKVAEANRHLNLVFSSEKDSGIYGATNQGRTRATGNVIGFLNADFLRMLRY